MTTVLDPKIVAEEVETIDQYRMLQKLDCEMAGGYLFSRPISSDLIDKIYVYQRFEPSDQFLNVCVPSFGVHSGAETICDESMTPLITAHRGYSQVAPENTIPAFELAIEHQADFIELDVQETKDHGLVVIHDSHLMRLAGLDRNLWNLTTSELASLDVGQWFGEAFKYTRIPSLASVMDLAKDRIKLNLELKCHGHEQALVSQVVELIHQKHWQQNCVVSSLDFDTLRQVRTLDPGLTIGPVISPSRPEYPDFEVDFYSLHFTLATPERVKQAHVNGKAIHVWTVNQPDDMQRMIELGVDNIITDQPAALKTEKASKQTKT